MTTAIIKRVTTGPKGTFGVFILNTKPICVTLEDPWMNNQNMVSCIPPGAYKCIPHSGDRFKNVWEVTKVPGRSAILIHAGNTHLDTHGCILAGTQFGDINGIPGILRSTLAMDILRSLLPEKFDLTIVGV